MAGIIQRAKGHYFNNPKLKRYYPDPRLRDGSLILLDPSHPDGIITTAPASTPNAVTTLRNIARKAAVRTVGGTVDQMDGSIVMGSAVSTNVLQFELTGKKALHGMMSQVNHNNFNQGAYITILANYIRDYIFAHPDHQYFVSIAYKKTRLQPTSPSVVEVTPSTIWTSGTTSNTNGLYAFSTVTTRPTSGALGSIVTPGYNILGDCYQAIGVSGWMGTAPASAELLMLVLAQWGNPLSLNSGSFFQNIWPSWALQSFNLIDLTVAGLTYSQYLPIDQAECAKLLAIGGRYAGDNYSLPSSAHP